MKMIISDFLLPYSIPKTGKAGKKNEGKGQLDRQKNSYV